MSLFPDFPVVGIQSDVQLPSRTYKLDLENGRILGMVNGIDAIRQSAMKSILTPRYKCYAYDDQYGSEIGSLLSMQDISREYIQAEMPTLLEDCLLADGRIERIDELSFFFDADAADIQFDIYTAVSDEKTSVEVTAHV